MLVCVCAGRAQPSMLSTISVDYYGAATPLQNLASVSAPDAQTLMIKPFDKSGIKVRCPTTQALPQYIQVFS